MLVLFVLSIVPLSPQTPPLSSSLCLSCLFCLPSELVLCCSSSPATSPSAQWRAHGCGLKKTPSVLAKSERCPLQWKLEPPGQATWEDLLSRTTLRQLLRACGGGAGHLLRSEPRCLNLSAYPNVPTSTEETLSFLHKGFLFIWGPGLFLLAPTSWFIRTLVYSTWLST